ncbi:sulfate transporter [Mycobacterium sp. ST-F2]|uniref:STAS domain-containing protein n=1 Tax=Mycobacterium sp. ST-F2 TaxID=1490484 RepID=UPI000961BAE3|nr:STAS domain-containing protein [Mycobacterium sp. ST-F2]OKH82396.1 sulfate transporter [Mycobacterium sp. ST-F2]
MTEPIHISAPVYGGSGEYTLICTGVLNGLSYRTVRDSVVKAALEEPRVVIVDVNELRVPEASAWSVFTSARWHVSTWPDVPILLVCASDEVRAVIGRRGITRWVPVFPTMQEAMQSAGSSRPRQRRRARADLPPHVSSIIDAQRLVGGWLSGWSCSDMIPVAAVIATALVENVLRHTESSPILRVEYDGRLVTVAVEDTSPALAQRKEDAAHSTGRASGLAIVTSLTRVWGNLPTSAGKTVWAVVGPENVL